MKKPSKKSPTYEVPRTPEAREDKSHRQALRSWEESLEAVAVDAMVAAGGDPKRCAWTKPSQMSRVVEVDGVPFARVEIEEDTLRVVTTNLREAS